jgi:hypothetical protein
MQTPPDAVLTFSVVQFRLAAVPVPATLVLKFSASIETKPADSLKHLAGVQVAEGAVAPGQYVLKLADDENAPVEVLQVALT